MFRKFLSFIHFYIKKFNFFYNFISEGIILTLGSKYITKVNDPLYNLQKDF